MNTAVRCQYRKRLVHEKGGLHLSAACDTAGASVLVHLLLLFVRALSGGKIPFRRLLWFRACGVLRLRGPSIPPLHPALHQAHSLRCSLLSPLTAFFFFFHLRYVFQNVYAILVSARLPQREICRRAVYNNSTVFYFCGTLDL